MRKLLLLFLLFIAGLLGLGRIPLPELIVGIGLMMAVVVAGHILATPSNN